jgi:predicted patatin/cPLA2 family phospholipase
MTIKHIVFSGGGPSGLIVLGSIQQLQIQGFWNIDDIESIYATSAGALLGIIICLKYDWETMNTYFVKRPWHDAYPITAENLINSYSNKGIFNNKVFEIFYKPLFDAKNIPLTITLREFYEYSHIDLNMYSLELNEYKIQLVSHKTFPDLPLLTAIHMSCAIPMIISPVCFEGKCFVDGGILNNYPIDLCLLDHPDKSEIMTFKNEYIESFLNIDDKEDEQNKCINETSNMYEFILCLIKNIVNNLNIDNQITIENEVKCKTEYMTIEFLEKTIKCENFRKSLLDNGIQCGNEFLENHNNNNNNNK